MKQTLREAAAETTQTAAERGAAALELAIERLMPLLEQAAERLAPYAEDAKVAAVDAKKRTARFAADTVEQFQPQINDALDKVSPAVEKAQKAVQDDLLPKLVDLLHEAAEIPALQPVVQGAQDIAGEVESRGGAAVAALKGELELPKKTSAGKRVAQVAAAGALIAAVAVAVKAFLGSKDSGWAAHEPSPAYTYTSAKSEDETFAEATLADDGAPVAEVVAEEPAADLTETLEETVVDEIPSDDPATSAPSEGYGTGSYMGENPPEGFTIKGNERSMKYHTTESGGYDRTIADVWFENEDAAKAAGFVRAQR
ncbi:MAG TPA: hypothetical protein PKM36_10090 [Propionibacteriaceae bacterium]|nr:hypothetical protein [Propionibacteriaceae bacterium]HPZ50637.1 hypothetical protein [Propionibacteriaceae bacterium]HQE31344.1 hypothetical protein [Propionibacteriaceae bacterium]